MKSHIYVRIHPDDVHKPMDSAIIQLIGRAKDVYFAYYLAIQIMTDEMRSGKVCRMYTSYHGKFNLNTCIHM